MHKNSHITLDSFFAEIVKHKKEKRPPVIGGLEMLNIIFYCSFLLLSIYGSSTEMTQFRPILTAVSKCPLIAFRRTTEISLFFEFGVFD